MTAAVKKLVFYKTRIRTAPENRSKELLSKFSQLYR